MSWVIGLIDYVKVFRVYEFGFFFPLFSFWEVFIFLFITWCSFSYQLFFSQGFFFRQVLKRPYLFKLSILSFGIYFMYIFSYFNKFLAWAAPVILVGIISDYLVKGKYYLFFFFLTYYSCYLAGFNFKYPLKQNTISLKYITLTLNKQSI